MKRAAFGVLIAALGAWALSGCMGTTYETVQIRGAYDLHCARENVRVQEIGGGAFRAVCHGSVATYVCEMPENAGLATEPTCRREAESR